MDFYQILEVSPLAEAEEIKRSFRRLAKLYHPDVNADPEAGEKFKLVYTAYDILQDPFKRRIYDEYRQARSSAPVTADHIYHEEPKSPAERSDPYFSKYRKWERQAAGRAQSYSEMEFDAFEKSILGKVSFHATQLFALIFFFIILVAGCVVGMAGIYLLTSPEGFNGSRVSAYALILLGGLFAFTGGRTIWLVFETWREQK